MRHPASKPIHLIAGQSTRFQALDVSALICTFLLPHVSRGHDYRAHGSILHNRQSRLPVMVGANFRTHGSSLKRLRKIEIFVSSYRLICVR